VILSQAAHHPVIENDAFLGAHQAIAQATRVQSGQLTGVDALQEPRCIRAAQVDFSQGAHIDDPGPLAHSARF
jgi:hypothetical protein